MNSLNLRKPDRKQELVKRHEVAKIAKRAHLKDLLSKDLLSRYPVDPNLPLAEQERIERKVTSQIDKLVTNSNSLNKQALKEVEK